MSIYKGTEFIAGTPDMAGYAKTSDISTMLATLYPVGSIYIGTQSTCPLTTLISGSTWELVSGGRVLQGADSSHSANSTIAAGLPNITGTIGYLKQASSGNYSNPINIKTGVFSNSYETTVSPQALILRTGSNEGSTRTGIIDFHASRSSSIYGSSSTVQPPAYVVNIWRRTA